MTRTQKLGELAAWLFIIIITLYFVDASLDILAQ